ncbi:UDP-3-O-(3-hydroxymyristoyl)glucosamine N-acyltransferase [Lichenicoccus sp.]|uniref:UDP-3-O-(3-hydroxymyristoyl)glucosamine N-acyltransferase n=1 Tax=Lichenicoccus sp. TaxID=2781899 RepID=UPI003D14F6D5
MSGTGDRRFFGSTGPYSAAELADLVGARLVPPAGGGLVPDLRKVAPLQSASSDEISFLDNRRYLALLAATRAGAVIVAPAFAASVPRAAAALVIAQPYLAWARIAALFHPAPAIEPGVHATAVIEAGAAVHPTAQIGAFAVIGSGASVGANSRVDPHAVIGAGVCIGAQCRIGAHVSVSHAVLGDRVTVYPGARIGQDGFGFAVSDDGFVSVPQLGRVLIGDDVEIGANTTVDRGSAQDTVIGAGSRLDNLVQIAHNVKLGRCCIVCGQAGIAGSTELEDFVTLASQAGLIGHIRIGRKARVGAQAGVMSDVQAGADVIGSPAMAFREFFRNVATLRRLSRQAKAGERDGSGSA